MRKLLDKGKWVALILIGVGLLFAGCAGSDSSSSSSEDDGLPIPEAENAFLFQVDPEGAKIDITPLTLGAATTSLPGHLLQLGTDPCVWESGTSTLSCDITLTNLDADYMMSPARTVTNRCATQVVGTCDNAQIESDYPTKGTTQLVDGASAGICYSEWGGDGNVTDPVPEGCSTYAIEGVDYPIQFLGAGGGSQTETWDLVGANDLYQFVTWFSDSEWYPENPYPHQIDGTTVEDDRFDFENYATWVVKFYDGSNQHAAYCGLAKGQGWELGTPWCSAEIDYDNVTNGATIYLNLMGEFADRIEQQIYDVWSTYDYNASGGTAEDFEYYVEAQMEVIFDPTVLDYDSSGDTDRAVCATGGNYLNSSGGQVQCAQVPEHLQINAFTKQVDATALGRIAALQSRTQNTFQIGSFYYITTIGGQTGPSWYIPGADLCVTCGAEGMQHWNQTATALEPDGVDADLDFWFSYVPMTVIGASGSYTSVKVAQRGNTNWVLNHSNGTLAGGYTQNVDIRGVGATGWCYSTGTGGSWPDCNTTQTCGDEVHVYYGTQKTTCSLPPGRACSRTDCPDGNGTCGGKPAWNRHIAVQ